MHCIEAPHVDASTHYVGASPNRSSVIQLFERSDAIEIQDGIMIPETAT